MRLQIVRSGKSARKEQYVSIVRDFLEQAVRLDLKSMGTCHHLSSNDGYKLHIHLRSSQAITHSQALYLFHAVCHKRVYFCHLKLLTFLCQSASGSFPEVTARFSHHPYKNKIFNSDNIRVPVHLPIFSHPFRGHLQRPALKQTD